MSASKPSSGAPHAPSAHAAPSPPRVVSAAPSRLWIWQMAWRDSRNQRGQLALYVLSIAIGISALVGIHALRATVQRGIDSQTKSLLGADVLISSRQPIPEESLPEASAHVAALSREVAFSSMLTTPEEPQGVQNGGSAAHTRLVQVRALEGDYPFYTSVETQPADAWKRLQSEGGVLVEPSLLEEFNVKPGARFKLGALELPILGSVLKGVPRSTRFSGFAPEVYIRKSDLPATGLGGTGSLVFHHLAVMLESAPPPQQEEWSARIRANFSQSGISVQTPADRRETIGENLDRVREFLGITALVALVLAGIGVAGAMHAHVRRRVQAIAILLCLGCPPNAALAVYLAQASVLGCLGSLAGAVAGSLLHALVVFSAGDVLPFSVEMWPEPATVLSAAGGGFLLCLSFALVPLLPIRDVPPGATLSQRTTYSAPRGRRLVRLAGVLSVAAVFGVALLNGSSPKRAFGLTLGLGAAFLCMAGAARLLMWATRRAVSQGWPYLLRQGISNLFRPRNQTLAFTLSLGLGVFLLLSIWNARMLLVRQMRVDDTPTSPNLYLVDVQPDQIPAVRASIEALQLPVLDSAPMVTMRIASVKGRPIAALERKGPASKEQAPRDSAGPDAIRVPRWVLEREYRSTYRSTLNATETLVAGSWIANHNTEAGAPVPLSLEQQLARDLQVKVGDELTLDVQGVPLQARVTSLRKVDWSKFNLNFFMVFPEGVLEDAPQFQLVATRIPPKRTSGDLQRALLRTAPNVSAVDLTSVLATVGAILQKAAGIVQILAGFTLAAGVPVVAGALLNGRDQRMRESVLLRTLGASTRQIRIIFLTEYAALGGLAALCSCLLAAAAHHAMARWIFQTTTVLDWKITGAAFASTVLGAVAAGFFLSRGVCTHPPMVLLRENN